MMTYIVRTTTSAEYRQYIGVSKTVHGENHIGLCGSGDLNDIPEVLLIDGYEFAESVKLGFIEQFKANNNGLWVAMETVQVMRQDGKLIEVSEYE